MLFDFIKEETKDTKALASNVVIDAYTDSNGCGFKCVELATNVKSLVQIKPSQSFTILCHPCSYCTGYYSLDNSTRVHCALGSTVKDNFANCQDCRSKETFNPFFYNVSASDISPQQQQRNKQPHSVYLAAFGPDINLTKVGITKTSRVAARASEQGALAFVVIAESPTADEARLLEAKIAKSTKIKENIQFKAKAQYLQAAGFNVKWVKSELQRLLQETANSYALDCSKWIETSVNYFTPNDDILTRSTIVTNLQISHNVTVKMVGVIGQMLILQNQQNKCYLVNVKKMFGKCAICPKTDN